MDDELNIEDAELAVLSIACLLKDQPPHRKTAQTLARVGDTLRRCNSRTKQGCMTLHCENDPKLCQSCAAEQARQAALTERGIERAHNDTKWTERLTAADALADDLALLDRCPLCKVKEDEHHEYCTLGKYRAARGSDG